MGVAADGLPEACEGFGEVGGGVVVVGEEAGSAFEEGWECGGESVFFGACHGVAADEGDGVGCEDGGEGEVWGAFDAADIGDEAGFGEAGEDGGGDEVRHCANGDGEDEEVCVGEGGWEVGGGVGDAEVLCFDE